MAGPWYANPSPVYQPAMRLVTAVTQAHPAVVTCSFDHDYISGTIVRMYVPKVGGTSIYGMDEMDKLVGTITVLTDDTFSINIDSTAFGAFVVPGVLAAHTNVYPHVIPIGEINSILTAATRNVL